jgi:transketolase
LQLADKDIRDALFDRVYELAEQDPNVVMLTDDMDAFSLRRFKQDFPERYINIGVAEQNMMNVAAGLATCGKRVFTYGIASYVTMRCFEQIKVNLCSMRLPVTIIGVGPGFSFEFDGPTHHGTIDVSVMRTLPEMSIYNPSDSALASACVDLAYENAGPTYIRLDKGKYPDMTGGNNDFSQGFRVLKPLTDVNIVSSGFMTMRALSVAEALEGRGISIGIVDLYRLKPVTAEFAAVVLGQSKRVVTIEESSIVGGVGTILAELLAESGLAVRLTRLAVPDKQFLQYGSREWLQRNNGLDETTLIEVISEITG